MNAEQLFARYRDLQAYVGWTDADAKRMAAILPRVQPHFNDLIDDFYEEISRHEEARKVITGGPAQIERLKQTLCDWLAELFSGRYDAEYVGRRWRVGWRHVEIGLNQVYTNAALSRLRSGLVRVLTQESGSGGQTSWTARHEQSTRIPDTDHPTSDTLLSLHKLLDLDLAIIEDAYQTEYVRRVEQRTADSEKTNAELLLLKNLALGIAAQPSLDDAMCLTLQRICEATGWDCGEAWLAEDDPPWLVLRARCSEDPVFEEFHRASEEFEFSLGRGLPGVVWANREPLWLDDLEQSSVFSRRALARRCGLTAGLGVPIFSGEQPVAVMTFFIRKRRDVDARLVELVTAAVAPLGPVVERKRFEDELAEHQRALERLVAERTAQLRQADRLAAIGTLAAGLGHDMHNVLLPVRSRLDVLDADAAGFPQRSREQLPAIRRAIVYLQELSDGLHLLALDPTDDEATTASTDISEWWSQLGPLLAKTLPKRVAFKCDIHNDLPNVKVAPHRLTQAVLNLLVNAGEAIADEGVVRLRAERDDHHSPSQTFVRLSVNDTGEGMNAEVKRRALDPFFTTKKRGLGTGLGLSLVHGVVQAAGGSVEIESEPGHGTTVALLLPPSAQYTRASHRAADEHGAPSAGTAPSAPPLATITLSDKRMAGFISTFVTAAGYDLHAPPEQDDVPLESALWVIDPAAAVLDAGRRFLRTGRNRRMIVVGPNADEWAALGAQVVPDASDVESLRSAINKCCDA